LSHNDLSYQDFATLCVALFDAVPIYNILLSVMLASVGRIPMRHLVYRVQALPQSMLPLVWDFGQLSTDVEELYIRQMVHRYVRILVYAYHIQHHISHLHRTAVWPTTLHPSSTHCSTTPFHLLCDAHHPFSPAGLQIHNFRLFLPSHSTGNLELPACTSPLTYLSFTTKLCSLSPDTTASSSCHNSVPKFLRRQSSMFQLLPILAFLHCICDVTTIVLNQPVMS